MAGAAAKPGVQSTLPDLTSPAKDASALGSLGSQSISAEAEFLSAELLKGIFPSSGERLGRGKETGSANGIAVAFANSLQRSVSISSNVLAVWLVEGVKSLLGNRTGSTGSAVPFAAVPRARTLSLRAASSLLSQGPSCPRRGCSLPGRHRGCDPASPRTLREFSLRGWGHVSHFLAWGRSTVSLGASLPRGWEKAGERVQPVSLEHPVPLKALWGPSRRAPSSGWPHCCEPRGDAHPSALCGLSGTSCRVLLHCSR